MNIAVTPCMLMDSCEAITSMQQTESQLGAQPGSNESWISHCERRMGQIAKVTGAALTEQTCPIREAQSLEAKGIILEVENA